MASLMGAGIIAALAMLVALPAIAGPRRWYIPLVGMVAFLGEFTTVWPSFRGSPLALIGGNWNWSGKLADLVMLLLIAGMFIAVRLFTRGEIGLTFKQRSGTGKVVAFFVLPLLVVYGVLVWKLADHEAFSLQTFAFELTMPGFTEELMFRGLLLALFDRMFAPARTLFGAPIGYGALATAFMFGAVHVVFVGRSLHPEFTVMAGIGPFVGGLILAWLRSRTGSLVVPILSHNIANTLEVIIPPFL